MLHLSTDLFLLVFLCRVFDSSDSRKSIASFIFVIVSTNCGLILLLVFRIEF
jgi:hypothetical protein